MKFILHEVKLWFNDKDSTSKSYEFLPDKVNVITGDASTGKTSFWRIIDYCFLSNKTKIPNEIIDKVSWFGICFTINKKKISIARKSPSKGAVGAEVFYCVDSLPIFPNHNIEISELKTLLDEEFGITDKLRFPFGKEVGKTSFNLSFRHFLIFNSLTEDIIGASETYFDTTFYGKEEYDKELIHIFDMVIGVNDMKNIKARERIQFVENEVRKIQKQNAKNLNTKKEFQDGILGLVNKLKENRLVEYAEELDSVNSALGVIDEVIATTKIAADNTSLFSEIDELNKRKFQIRAQISAISRYRKEYDAYKKNLSKSADSLRPIEFLNKNLSDQLIDSYETKNFVDLLEASLKEIQSNLSKSVAEPLKVSGDAKELNTQLQIVESRITQLHLINKNFQSEGVKFMIAGEVKNAREQLFKNYNIKPVDQVKLNELYEEKSDLEKNIKDIGQTKFVMKTSLNECIQRNYNLLNSMPSYKNCETIFNDSEMALQLRPEGQIFVLDNVGSKSNYMFMHLSFYLGLHEHIINVSPEHVPQFLFVDQPSIPYYSGNDTAIGNDDKTKLLDAFSLLNSFIDFIKREKGESFQMFMVEHAPKEYWTENGLANFYTVAEFINGNGLIPNNIYNA